MFDRRSVGTFNKYLLCALMCICVLLPALAPAIRPARAAGGALYRTETADYDVTFSTPTDFAVPETALAAGSDDYFSAAYASFSQLQAYIDASQYGAKNLVFDQRVADASAVKSITINLCAYSGGDHNLFYESGGDRPYYRLYPVNLDGTVNADKYFEFTETNVTAFDTWSFDLTLDSEDIWKLTDADGGIQALQWSYHHFNKAAAGGNVYFAFKDITYELYDESVDDFPYTVTFMDTDDHSVIETVETYSFINPTDIPENGSVTGFSAGYGVEWLDENDLPFDFGTILTGDVVLHASLIKDVSYFTRTLFDASTGGGITFSTPTEFASDSAKSSANAAINGGDSSGIWWFKGESYPNWVTLQAFIGYWYGAANLTFADAIDNARAVKSISFDIQYASATGSINYNNAGSNAYYRLHAVNADGSVDPDHFEFTESNLSDCYETWGKLTLGYDDILKLTDDEGKIRTLQWSFFHNLAAESADPAAGFIYFFIKGITYELYGPSEYHNVTFKNTDDGQILGAASTPSVLLESDFPDADVAGYPLAGHTLEWRTLPAGNGAVFERDSLITDDMTLYAHWAPNLYTIKFESTGGNAVADLAALYGSAIDKPDNPTRAGYVFAGWFTEASGGTEFDFSVMDEDRTLYARWTETAGRVGILQADGGTVALDGGTEVRYGQTVRFTVTADAGYRLTGVYVTYGTGELTIAKHADGSYSFTAMTPEVEIRAEFLRLEIKPSSAIMDGKGKLAFSKDTYEAGEEVVIYIVPNAGYKLKSLKINGISFLQDVSDGKITIASLAGELSVEAEFARTNGAGIAVLSVGSVFAAAACAFLAVVLIRKKRSGRNSRA
jgi:uncharacterized repeat protein (TIGR02543 family)